MVRGVNNTETDYRLSGGDVVRGTTPTPTTDLGAGDVVRVVNNTETDYRPGGGGGRAVMW